MPLTLIALSKVDDQDAGLACSLVNTGRMAGSSLGLAILDIVAWSGLTGRSRAGAGGLRGFLPAGHAAVPGFRPGCRRGGAAGRG